MMAIELGRVETYATREAWELGRTRPGGMGASEIAGVLGVHPQLTPWAVWEKAMGRKPDEGIVHAFVRGHRWEPAVLAEYGDECGCEIVEPGAHFGKPGHLVTIAHPDHDWLRMSPDAFGRDRYDGPRVVDASRPPPRLWGVEAKTAMHANVWSPEPGVIVDRWDDAHASLIPAHYAVQAYIQLSCSGFPFADVCALVPDRGWLSVRWVRVMRDAPTQDALVDAAAEWRERHIVRGEEPDVDGSRECSRFIAAKFPRVSKSLPERDATEAEAAAIRSLVGLRRNAKAIKDQTAELANKLAMSAEGHRLLMGRGKGAPYAMPLVTKAKQSIDVVRLRRDFPEAARICTKVGAPSVQFRAYRLGDDDTDNDGEE